MTLHHGGCLCGAVRYQFNATPQAVAACHCRHCQRASGSAFSVNLLVSESSYQQQGETRVFIDHGDSGLPSERHFCGQCGSPVFTRAGNLPERVLIKAGTLDQPQAFAPQLEIYTDHALPWHSAIASTHQFAQAPAA